MRILLLVAFCLLLSPAAQANDEAHLWRALREGGHVALIRHALAPGNFDPPGLKIGDCGTQRNLSDEGRAQARMIGERFRKNGVATAALYSSEWCRCMDTATEMRLGPVRPLPALNTLHYEGANAAEQSAAVLQLIRQHRGNTLVLVTHQTNISRLVNTGTGSGEIVVARLEGDELKLVGRIP